VRFFRLIAVLALALLPYGASAQVKSTADAFTFDSSKPISVAADRLEVDNKLQVANFIGNVVAVQDNIMMNSDMVSIHYRRDDAEKPASDVPEAGSGLSAITGENGKVQSIVSAGRVVVVQEGRRATCEQVLFDQEKGTVTMTGDPKLYWGTDMLQGDKIVVHVQEQRVEVIGAPTNRVKANVVPRNAKAEFPARAEQRVKELKENPPGPAGEKKPADQDKKKTGPGNLILQEPTPDG
jgi:lipopolysaccharide export system protein LptA